MTTTPATTAEPTSTPSNVVRMTHSSAVYTVEEVQHLLSLSRGATYTMVRNGEIPAKKIGARWVIPKTRFHAWLNDLPDASLEDIAREFSAGRQVKVIELPDDTTGPSNSTGHNGRGA